MWHEGNERAELVAKTGTNFIAEGQGPFMPLAAGVFESMKISSAISGLGSHC